VPEEKLGYCGKQDSNQQTEVHTACHEYVAAPPQPSIRKCRCDQTEGNQKPRCCGEIVNQSCTEYGQQSPYSVVRGIALVNQENGAHQHVDNDKCQHKLKQRCISLGKPSPWGFLQHIIL